jgi:hypothetical protein
MVCGTAPEHDADHGEVDEGCGLSSVSLVVAAEAAVAADPSQRPLHDPALGQDHEMMEIRTLDDLQRPQPGPCDDGLHLRSLVAAIADDALDEREAPTRLPQERLGAVAVLHAAGVHIDIQQQAKPVDEHVTLAPEDLLARVEPLRIKDAPPFTAPLALWASMMAVVGLASRPACSRHRT